MLYMAVLVAAVLAVLLTALALLGRFDTREKELAQTLSLQLEVFENDIHTLRKNLNAMGTHFSEDMTRLLESELNERDMTFDRLAGDLEAIREIERRMLEPICQYAQQAECSGAFVVLDTAVRDYESGKRSGIYVQKSSPNRQVSELLLFRGIADIGAPSGMTHHRKWTQAVDSLLIPNYESVLSGRKLLEDGSCLFTDAVTLHGTNEKGIFALMPIVSPDGRVYGLCGFELSQTWFASRYAQPSNLSRMACVVAPGNAASLDIPASLRSIAVDTYAFWPAEALTIGNLSSDLSVLKGSDASFIGLVTDFHLSGNGELHKLAVMIPEQDYRQARFSGHLELTGLSIFLLFFVVICCVAFSRRFIRPILRDLSHIENQGHMETQAQSLEFDQAFDALTRREQTHAETISGLTQSVSDSQSRVTLLREQRERMQTEMQSLRQQYDSVQTELENLLEAAKEPDEVRQFRANLRQLSSRERQLYEAYIAGFGVKEAAARLAISESTVYYYNKKMYEKLGVHSIKELCRLAELLEQPEETR